MALAILAIRAMTIFPILAIRAHRQGSDKIPLRPHPSHSEYSLRAQCPHHRGAPHVVPHVTSFHDGATLVVLSRGPTATPMPPMVLDPSFGALAAAALARCAPSPATQRALRSSLRPPTAPNGNPSRAALHKSIATRFTRFRSTDSHTAKSARCLSSPPTVDLLHSALPTKSASSKPLQRVLRRAPKPNLSRPRSRLTSVVTLVLRRLKALFGLAQSAVCYQHVRDGARRCRGSVQPSRRGPKDRGARGAGSRSGKAKVRRERSIYNPQCQYICPPGVSPLIVSINLINHH